MSRLQEAYAKNSALIAEAVKTEQDLTAQGLLNEQILALKETIAHRDTRVIELEKMLDDILKKQPAEDAVIFTGNLQQVTVQGEPIPVGKETLASLTGARLQFVVVAP
ncbi:hypothetical protein [uncultured Rothia sp.]|uniref:hypothetical protein n=1 Tax=uncultured Rothia sp. TaxID=316088 RepID=UPI00321643C8